MAHDTIQHDIFNASGTLAVACSIFMNAWNFLSDQIQELLNTSITMEHINPTLTFCVSVMALLFTFAKWKGQRLDNRIKKRQLKKLDDEHAQDI